VTRCDGSLRASCRTDSAREERAMSFWPTDAWYAIHVTCKSEKTVESLLQYKGYEPFVPRYLSRKRWSDRLKTVELPLFPGYVFVRALEMGVGGLVCSTPGVKRVVGFGGRPSAIPDSEIDVVRRLTFLGKALPVPYLRIGQRVEIRDGPFAGIIGIIRKTKDRASIIVSIELISRSICVEVDESQIGAMDPAIPHIGFLKPVPEGNSMAVVPRRFVL
jgi:transcription antitermination factor NusG